MAAGVEAAASAPDGYGGLALSREGQGVVVYTAERERDDVPVLLKTSRRTHPSQRDREQAAHEFAVLTLLEGAPVARALGLEETKRRPWLVLEDPGGQSLDRLSASFREPALALALGARIAGALHEVHRCGVFHRGLAPQAVLVLDDGSVRLTDFRSASLLRVDWSVGGLTRRPAYAAPEQTGRMNRPVDKRADLYALGVMLYELLTGRLPFEGSDPLEWTHAHIAKTPTPPSQLDGRIPAAADAIVLKLLSKHAEDRYHGAAGLQRDLERCAAASLRGEHAVFELGGQDAPDDFRVARRLYGREVEIARLVGGFDRARTSGSSVVTLIGGYSGVGKSSLVAELYQPIVRERGRFVSGKFDQYERDIPYATIAQAFRDLLRSLLSLGDDSLSQWRHRLCDALGINAQLIVNVIPELELIVGPQAAVFELDALEGQNRFELAFGAFVRVFARPEHPLVVFLDDMQWADGATLALLKLLARPGQFPHLQLLLAFRDNEVDASHPFELAVAAMRAGGACLDPVTVLDLEPGHVLQLVADTVSRLPADAASLATMIGTKAGGNPFFIGELLQVLHARGLLAFDIEVRGWTWDDAALRALDTTDNVLDLLIGRIRILPVRTRRALALAACFGSRFDVGTLAAAIDAPVEAVETELHHALAEGFIVTVDDSVGPKRTFRFQHDRIQQAAYSLAADERAATHLRIGRIFRNRLEGGEDGVLFDATNHLNHAVALVVDAAERQRLVELNLRAGRRAKAAIAWEPARVYLASAASLFGNDAWTCHYATTFAVLRELAECEFLVGQFAAAELRFDELRRQARTRAERGDVANAQVKLCIVTGRYDDALHLGLEELELFGELLSATEAEVAETIRCERQRLSETLTDLDLRSLVDRPVVTDPEPRARIVLLASVAPAVYSRRPSLFPLLAMRIVNLSLEHGNCEHSCFGYSMYAMTLAAGGDTARALTLSEASIALNERFRDPKLRGTVLHIHANHIVFWRRPYAEANAIQERAYLASMEVGDLTIAAYVSFMGAWQCLARGETLGELDRALERFDRFAVESHHEAAQLAVQLMRQFGRALAGLTASSSALSDERFDADQARARIAAAGFDTGLVMHDLLRAMLAWHHGEYLVADSWLARGSASLPAASCLPLETAWALFDALTAAALWDAAAPKAHAALLGRVERAEARLRGWAAGCPANFEAEHALAAAELARLQGRSRDASNGYERAAEAARREGHLPLEAIAAHLAVRLARSGEQARATRWWLRDAHSILSQWGASSLLSMLTAAHPEVRAVEYPLTADAEQAAGQQLDVLTALKASQALARETAVDGLTQALLRIVLEHAGAQRAVVLLMQQGQLKPAGSASVDGDSSGEVPESMVRYVERTAGPIVLADAATDPTFGGDAYVVRVRPRSVLCLPILVRSRVVLLLYLENNLITGAFAAGRLALLEVVSTQLAISLENAELYAERQERAEHAARHEAATAAALFERSRLAALFEQAPAAIVMLDGADHVVTLANARYQSMAGNRPLRGRTIRDAFPEMAGQGYYELLDRVFETGESFEAQGALVKLSQGADDALEDYFFDFVCQPFRDAAHAVQGIMVLAFDVSDRVRAQAERQGLMDREQAARREAEIANRSKDEFLAMLGHELRNPLAPIVTALHLLRLRDGDRNQKERSLIERHVTHLVRLVDDLLDVSRITSGKVELKRQPIEMAEVVAKAIEMASPLLEQRRHELVVAVPKQGHMVDGDVTRLAQIVSNLLTNAAKYTEPGGRVTIAAERVAGSLVLRVCDTGIGLAPEMLPRVFDLFAQEAQALSRSQGGLGLGLAIVRSLVGLHGGTVCAESPGLGQGTQFTVRLPLLEGATSAAAAPASFALEVGPTDPPAPRAVLIVDDNEDAAEMLAVALTNWGHTVRVAHDGPAALQLVADFVPDVALLDIGLPIMDGYELARLLKERAALRHTRLVALTGYGQESDRLLTRKAGFDAHLVKPVDLDGLRTLIDGCSRPATPP